MTTGSPRGSLAHESEAVKAKEKAVGNDYQSKTGEGEQEMIHELESTLTSYVKAKRTEFTGGGFFIPLDIQFMIVQKIEKRTAPARKRNLPNSWGYNHRCISWEYSTANEKVKASLQWCRSRHRLYCPTRAVRHLSSQNCQNIYRAIMFMNALVQHVVIRHSVIPPAAV